MTIRPRRNMKTTTSVLYVIKQ